MRVVETIANSILIVLINICTGIISARLLGPSGRGELASILLGLQLISLLSIVGLPTSSIFYLKKVPEYKSEIVGGTLLLATLLGLFASLIGYILVPHWLADYSTPIVTAAQLTILLTPSSLYIR